MYRLLIIFGPALLLALFYLRLDMLEAWRKLVARVAGRKQRKAQLIEARRRVRREQAYRQEREALALYYRQKDELRKQAVADWMKEAFPPMEVTIEIDAIGTIGNWSSLPPVVRQVLLVDDYVWKGATGKVYFRRPQEVEGGKLTVQVPQPIPRRLTMG